MTQVEIRGYVLFPGACVYHNGWPKLGASARALLVEIYLMACECGMCADSGRPFPVKVTHDRVSAKMSAKTFRRARKELVLHGFLGRCFDAKSEKPLRDYYMLLV